MTILSQIVQYTISGITSGSIYAIIGICWSVVYVITSVMNFATGEFVMLGGMLTWGFQRAGFDLATSAVFAVICTIFVALVLEIVVIRPVRYPTEMIYMMITIASASIIKGIILLKWGSETRTIQPFISTNSIHILGATLTPQVLFVLSLLLIVTLGLWFFLNRTLFGKSLRASAIKPYGAQLVGINIDRFKLFSFGLAGGLGSITGIVITPITFTGYEIGLLAGLKGLVAAIIGGWTMSGTLLAGLALGLLEGFGAGFISSGLKDIFSLLVMIIFLILKTISFPPSLKKGLHEMESKTN